MHITSIIYLIFKSSNDATDIIGKDRDLFPKGMECKNEVQIIGEMSENLKYLKHSFDILR